MISTPSNIAVLLLPEFELVSATKIASLWSDYGFIHRLCLSSYPRTLILKSIHPPDLYDASESNLRKLVSYDVERWFYQHLATRLPPTVKLARSYPLREDQDRNLLLEDLSTEFPVDAGSRLSEEATLVVLRWLAGFHRTFFRVHVRGNQNVIPFVSTPKQWKKGAKFSGVWARGTYWHLDARREELECIDKRACKWLLPWVEKVNDTVSREIEQYGTLVHGDAKDANMLFNRDPYGRRKGKTKSTDMLPPLQCALYDLQYVGLGLVTYDLVYFLATAIDGSLLSPTSEKDLIMAYHGFFHDHNVTDESEVPYDFDILWNHWELAIVDWYRFMAGWGFWGHDSWVERRAREIVAGRIASLVSQ